MKILTFGGLNMCHSALRLSFMVSLAILGTATTIFGEPVLTSMNPSVVPTGYSTAIQVFGAGFASGDGVQVMVGSQQYWHTTTYLSSTSLQINLLAEAVSRSAMATVTVVRTGCCASGSLSLKIGNPPIVSSVTPTTVAVGNTGFLLTLSGSNFLPGATIYWNGNPLATTYISSTQLTAVASSVGLQLTPCAVWVVNPDTGVSNAMTISINLPTPVISEISPNSAIAGSSAFTLSVTGSSFLSTAKIYWGSTELSTSYVSSTKLTGVVPSNLINSAGTTAISAWNFAGTSTSQQSNVVGFIVVPPQITTISPTSATAGSSDLTLTVTGTGFLSGSVIQWNGVSLTTTFVNSAQLQATVSANRLAVAGQAAVSVTNPGGAYSSCVVFVVNAMKPTISQIYPDSIAVRSESFTLVVTGTGFLTGATVTWNATVLQATVISDTQLAATVPSSLLITAGAVSVSVSTTAGLSNPVSFTIYKPCPTTATDWIVNWASGLTSIAPGSLISIYGTALSTGTESSTSTPLPISLSGTSVTINGTEVPLLYVSPTQINAQVPFETAVGTATMVVRSSDGTSAEVSLKVSATAPGIAMITGSNHAIALNAVDWTLNSQEQPVETGAFVSVYLTGQGAVDNPVATGAAAPVSPLSNTVASVSATVGGQAAEVTFAGLAPGMVGVLQVNIKIPSVASGEQLLEITIGGVKANTAVLSVKQTTESSSS